MDDRLAIGCGRKIGMDRERWEREREDKRTTTAKPRRSGRKGRVKGRINREGEGEADGLLKELDVGSASIEKGRLGWLRDWLGPISTHREGAGGASANEGGAPLGGLHFGGQPVARLPGFTLVTVV